MLVTDEASEIEPKPIVSCGINDASVDCCISNGTVKLECGHKLPIVTLACDSHKSYSTRSRDNFPVYNGFVGVEVKVLRDTGCSSVVVRRDLVPKDYMTGTSKYCVLLDGTVRKFPVAKINVK